jgi:hypothetical protein
MSKIELRSDYALFDFIRKCCDTDKINFKHTYIRPRVVVHVVHTALSTNSLQVNVGPLTGTGCRLRSGLGLAYVNIDVNFSISIYVEESAGL